MGRRDCLAKTKFFFTSSGAQRWAEREMGNTKKNTATLRMNLSGGSNDGYNFLLKYGDIISHYSDSPLF